MPSAQCIVKFQFNALLRELRIKKYELRIVVFPSGMIEISACVTVTENPVIPSVAEGSSHRNTLIFNENS